VCFRFVAVCHLLKTGVAAIFGPQSPQTASHVQSICDTMEIPHLETRWDFRLRRESCLVNLYPHPRAISKVGRNITEIINARADYFPRRPQKNARVHSADSFCGRRIHIFHVRWSF
jgi:Receptor family ligand binding region